MRMKPNRILLIAICIIMSLLMQLNAVLSGEPAQNFEWRGADLRDAFRHVGKVFEVNIVLDSNVKGEVTMTLNQVTCEQAIQYLARSNGFNYRKTQTSYIIGREDALKVNFDVTSTRVFRIFYADAKNVANSVSVVVNPSKVKVDVSSNSLIVNGTPLELENVQEIIRMIDIEAPQISIEARLEEMSGDAKKQLGLQASVSGPISWDMNQINLPDLNLVLQAMQEERKSRTVARPNITTLNGQEGRILVGEKIPVKVVLNNEDGSTTTTITFIEVGVKLYITPRVNKNGDITLYLRPEVSTITSTTAEGYPGISTREVETIMRVKDGETVIIGGLMRQTDLDTVYKLPILSSLPVIGNFFKFRSTGTAPQTELVFFITPRITHPGGIGNETNAGVKPEPPKTDTGTAPAGSTPAPAQPAAPPVQTEPAPQPPSPEQPATQPAPPVVVVVPVNPGGSSPQPTEPKPDSPSQGTSPAQPATPAVNVTVQPVEPDKSIPSEVAYTVKKGDTLYSIARKYGIKVEALYEANKMNRDTKLEVDQVIRIPIPKEHIYIVKPGDTAWRLAKRYGITVELLCEINNLSDPNKLFVGQALILPCPVTDVKDDRY